MSLPTVGRSWGLLGFGLLVVGLVVASLILLFTKPSTLDTNSWNSCPADAPVIGNLLAGQLKPTGALDLDLLPGGSRARLSYPNIDASRDGKNLRACVFVGAQGYSTPVNQVLQVPNQPGQVDLMIGLPLTATTLNFARSLQIAVGSTDGTISTSSTTLGMELVWSIIYATVGAAAFVLWILELGRRRSAARTRWSSLLGRDGQPSLSLLQIGLWTVLVSFGLMFVFFRTGDLLTLTPQVMALLGFAGLGSLAARWAGSGQAKPPPGAVAADGTPVKSA